MPEPLCFLLAFANIRSPKTRTFPLPLARCQLPLSALLKGVKCSGWQPAAALPPTPPASRHVCVCYSDALNSLCLSRLISVLAGQRCQVHSWMHSCVLWRERECNLEVNNSTQEARMRDQRFKNSARFEEQLKSKYHSVLFCTVQF